MPFWPCDGERDSSARHEPSRSTGCDGGRISDVCAKTLSHDGNTVFLGVFPLKWSFWAKYRQFEGGRRVTTPS